MSFTTITSAVELGFEVAGLLALIIGTLLSFLAFLVAVAQRRTGTGNRVDAYRALRGGLGKAILLGLELLVAADIVRSVAASPTFASIGVLGLIVVVRTFLSWSLEVEISGEWPWRRAASRTPSERNTAV
jgi:uncharacterized membrane protein